MALFGETFWRWWRRPQLVAIVRMRPPDCHKSWVSISNTDTGATVDESYWFRMWIENTGHGQAEQVQVLAARLLQQDAEGAFRERPEFLPMNFLWTHTGEAYAPRISPKIGRHCELGRILRRLPGSFELLLEVAPLTGWHILGPGTYRIELRLAAANATPRAATLELAFNGTWDEDETIMLGNNATIRVL